MDNINSREASERTNEKRMGNRCPIEIECNKCERTAFGRKIKSAYTATCTLDFPCFFAEMSIDLLDTGRCVYDVL